MRLIIQLAIKQLKFNLRDMYYLIEMAYRCYYEIVNRFVSLQSYNYLPDETNNSILRQTVHFNYFVLCNENVQIDKHDLTIFSLNLKTMGCVFYCNFMHLWWNELTFRFWYCGFKRSCIQIYEPETKRKFLWQHDRALADCKDIIFDCQCWIL